jgi:hypothetical protein
LLSNRRRIHTALWVGALATALLALAAPALADSQSFSGDLSTSDSVQDFGGGDRFYYDLYEFTVSDDGVYTLEGDSADFDDSDDPIFALYEGDYDNGAPTDGQIAYDDDSGASLLPLINIGLSTCTKYVLLVSSYQVEDTGSYSFHISGPGDIGSDSCAGGAGSIAGNLLDGRINRDPAFDVAAPVAVYCNEAGTFDVWAINAESGDGLLVFSSTADQMTAAAPAEQVTLSSEHGVWVYRQADGSFQVHAGYFDGKPYWFSFDTCPPTWTYTTPPA